MRSLRVLTLVAVLLSTVLLGGVPDAAARPAKPAHTISYDHYSFSIDGKRVYLWSGEFHYWRLPSPQLWRDVLQKMKAGGFNAVSIYFDWAFHSPKQGVYDFTGIRDVDRLLDIAQDVGIYVIARPGPYINAETDSGGLPGWLTTQAGKARTSAPDYLAAAKEWFRHIDPILARHQLTDGRGTVILDQIENEYSNGALDPAYMQALEDQARADGITVPLFHNDVWPAGNWKPGTPGGVDVYAFDGYPQGFDCSNPQVWQPAPDYRWTRGISPGTPISIAEFQGGSFDPWGGPGYDQCRQLTGPDFESVFYTNNIASGATFQNFYMTFGGTSWGWLPDPGAVYSSYDYGAAITESRQLTSKYDEQKRIGYFTQSVTPLAKTDYGPDLVASNPVVQVKSNVNPDTGTRFLLVQHRDTTATTTDSTTVALDAAYPTVPQQGSLTLRGRDAKLLVAGYDFGSQHLVYSTSEIMTQGTIGGTDTALLYGDGTGETVLHFATQPHVSVLSGSVSSTWDPSKGDLRLDYVHNGLARVRIEGGKAPLELLIADTATSAGFWRQDTGAGPVLERGPYLVRDAKVLGPVLALTGDTKAATQLEVWAPPSVKFLLWNGRLVPATRTAEGTLVARLAGPQPVTLPALTTWQHQYETPEANPAFDDSSWVAADHLTTNNPAKPPAGQPVLYADDYGYHYGDVWYRGRFQATGGETTVTLSATTGTAGQFSAWLNGVYLGTSGPGTKQFPIPAGALKAGNVLSVLVENMGHNEDWNANDSHKEPRGLTAATVGADPIAWKIQGALGGENGADPVRGPLNNGGLYGERNGWSLPGFNDASWPATTLPSTEPTPGVSWYRTTFALHLPAGQDNSIGLRIDDNAARNYRAEIFVNGWNLGRYVNNVGPQHVFVLPNGILRTDGQNTIAIASWGADDTGGLGAVSLVNLG
ncbi:beta-galactosidase [Amycolatopsis bartoniae]|uniref:beta-galactosidase n=1 Tax=Amycolatopsis bartoniae TaxID=941986 RepID=A0A8H9IWR5_9PSEU|nr:beta-galactosidase [Amycolatopsis bartoniae]MBB2938447.1 beta-galactosidase [Amycolatopsis bartoniae]TVT10398.1 beta-galactosidase [Amycolatopsis bartoniae]GHF70925.1 beta-galactosidase [Amycolatopsis bartoniae]